MSKLSKEQVHTNDRVYDLVQGYGTVIDTAFDEITVKFDNGIRISYNPKGHYGGVKRLFWHSPVVVEPPKNIEKWEALKKCLTPIYELLNR